MIEPEPVSSPVVEASPVTGLRWEVVTAYAGAGVWDNVQKAFVWGRHGKANRRDVYAREAKNIADALNAGSIKPLPPAVNVVQPYPQTPAPSGEGTAMAFHYTAPPASVEAASLPVEQKLPAPLIEGAGEPSRHERAFLAFHEGNPEIYRLFVKYARRRRARLGPGATCGIKAVLERVRWEVEVETTSADGFKLNNNHAPYYARLIMAENRDLAGVFNTRALAAEREDA